MGAKESAPLAFAVRTSSPTCTSEKTLDSPDARVSVTSLEKQVSSSSVDFATTGDAVGEGEGEDVAVDTVSEFDLPPQIP